MSPYPVAPIKHTHYRRLAKDEPTSRPGNIWTVDIEKSTGADWSQLPTPMNRYWRNFLPQAKILVNQGPEGLRTLQDTLNAKPEKTRWINDLLPQIERVLRKGQKEVILLLGLCPLCNKSTSNFDHTSCRTDAVASGFEMPDGPPVILLDIRKDCIRQALYKEKEEVICFPMQVPEFKESLPHLLFELYIIHKIFKIKISSVVGFSQI
jgi:hypothetical protein